MFGDEFIFVFDVIFEMDVVCVVVLMGVGKVFCVGVDFKGCKDVIKGLGDLLVYLC